MQLRLNPSRFRIAMMLLVAAISLECESVGREPVFQMHRVSVDGTAKGVLPKDGPYAALAATDPMGFLRLCRDRCANSINDYRCRFVRQERLAKGLSSEQETEVQFRQSPFSVDMRWVRNADKARRISYVAGRWAKDGREFALIEPAGFLGFLAPSGVKRDIQSPEVRAGSRRSIDQFGFRNTLELIIKYSELAQGSPGYDLRYVGMAELEGRESYVLERRLPVSPLDQPYPDRLLVIYIDREWLVPTGCFAYSDDAGRELLGRYITKSVHLNVGLTDADF